MKHKIALLTAIFMVLFSLTAFAEGFSDMPAKDSMYYEAFEYAIKNNIIQGSGGQLLPNAPITRAEALTFISRAKPFTAAAADISKVVDVLPTDWFYNTMAQAVGAGLIAPDQSNCLYPAKTLTMLEAEALICSALGSTFIPDTGSGKAATRGDFIYLLYKQLISNTTTTPTDVTAPSEEQTEAPTEAPTEFSDLKAQAAREAMQLALGIRADGSSYVKNIVYRDYSQTDWASGKITGGSSGGSSGGSRPERPTNNNDNNDNDDSGDDEQPTEAPTQAPTEAPTEAPTKEPVYGEYDGPIDNDKDNVIDDPFDDGWRPGGSSNPTEGNPDIEDDDFIIDGEEPLEPPTTSATNPTEGDTEPETEDATTPSGDDTTESGTEDVTAPSEDDTTESETEDTTAPSEDDTTESETGDITAPSEDDTTDEEPTAPEADATLPEEEDDNSSENESGNDTSDTDDNDQTTVFSKDWWFDED